LVTVVALTLLLVAVAAVRVLLVQMP